MTPLEQCEEECYRLYDQESIEEGVCLSTCDDIHGEEPDEE